MTTASPITHRETFCAIRLLTEAQVGEELGVTRITLQRWRKAGMPYVALGSRLVRYNLFDVMEWLEKRKVAPRAVQGKEVIS